MSDSVKQRLIGAIVLLIVAACLWPIIFKPAENPTIVLQSKIPDVPELQVFEVPLQKATTEMPNVADQIESKRPALTRADVEQAEALGDANLERVEPREVADTLILDTVADEPLETNTVSPLPKPNETPAEAEAEVAGSDETAPIDEAQLEGADERSLEPAVTTEQISQDEPPAVSQTQATTMAMDDKNTTDDKSATGPETVKSPAREYTLKDANTPPTYANYDGPMWALQTGAFGDVVNAVRMADELRAKNFSVVIQNRFGTTRELAFVLVGPYFNLDNARTGIVELENAGFKSTLVEFSP